MLTPIGRPLAYLALALGAQLATAAPSLGHWLDDERRSQLTGLLDERVMSAQSGGVPPASPRAECGPGSNPEPGIQGRVPADAVESGRADDGFSCNIELLAHRGRSGGFKVHRFVDGAGRECAYYDTTLLFPTNVQNLSDEPTGVAVLDMSNPSKPVHTATLQTPAMQTPHESLVLNERRGLLVAVMGTATFYPGFVDIYDLTADCRHPELQSSLPVGLLGHESGFAPDGNTFYATSLFNGEVTAVDVRDPKLPVPLWVGDYPSHGLTVSQDGNRAYLADLGQGLTILDVSEIQQRRPNPRERVVSRLTWEMLTIPQVAVPVEIQGRRYLVEVDEFSTEKDSPIPVSNGERVGAARIIDIENEQNPRVVSDIRLAVNQPENRAQLAEDPGASSPAQGYAAHYCSVPRYEDPGIVACSFIASGLRVFDIRDPASPREIAYFVAPAGPPTLGGPGGPPSNYAMSAPAFVPERGEIWYSDGNTGFYALRVTNGAWPFRDGSAVDRRSCLSRRSAIGPRNVGRVRLGYTRRRMLRRVAPAPLRRGRHAYRWCVQGSTGRVSAVFSSRSAKGRARLVTTTAPRHVQRGVRRGTGMRRLALRFPEARRVARGVYRAGPRSLRIFGVRRGRVRFAGVAGRRLLGRPRALVRYLRRAAWSESRSSASELMQ